MKRSTAIWLVCLRLAIGWHFAVEGWQKIRSTDLDGPSETSKPFSSEVFFRESPGPMARLMKWQLGDPDDTLLALVAVQPRPADQDPAKYPAQNRIPPRLSKEWDDYFSRFKKHYGIDAAQEQTAEVRLQQLKHDVVVWMTDSDKKTAVTKTFPSGTVDSTMTVGQRIAEYRAKVQELRDSFDKKLPAFGKDVEKQRIGKLKTDIVQLRTALAADLTAQTENMQKSLADVLTDEQRKLGPVPTGPDEKASDITKKVRRWVRGNWYAEPSADVGPPLTQLEIINAMTRWGLFLIGMGLLLGLFTRTWCILGAGFLMMTYLSSPPFPWWPAPPQTEGNYLFVNKNLVEMLALVALATTNSGRWLGLDAMLHGLFTGFRGEQPGRDNRSRV